MIVRFCLAAGLSFLGVSAVLNVSPLAIAGRPSSDGGQRADDRRLLLIGNSRTYYHDMPNMLAKMAESSGRARFAVTLRAWGGAGLEENWRDVRTRQLMAQKWDAVVIQAESRAQSGGGYEASFLRGAADLSNAAWQAGNTPSFVVNYAYDRALYADDPEIDRRRHFQAIDRSFRLVRERHRADLIPVLEAWDTLLSRRPRFALYEDGNHPTLHGSFFQALVIFAHLTRSDAGAVTYRPHGVDQDALRLMKSVVKDMFDRNEI